MSQVRGPNSALTEFLRSQGISAADIRRRHEERQARAESDDPDQPTLVNEIANQIAATTDDPEVAAIAAAAASKRRRDEDDASNEGTGICAYCSARFTLTVYTREISGGGVLCRNCSNKKKPAPKKKTTESRKKRKQLAESLLEMKQTVAPTLQDLCISTVAEYIDDVDELGDMTSTNFNKISRILTKNRRLNPHTVQLFLRPDIYHLEFWDCSALTPESFNLIPAMCPNLESITLGMCGQFNNENLMRLASLPNLKQIYLDGPFMVRKEAWLDFIDTVGKNLTHFTVKSVYRIDAEVLAVLADTCTNLELLGLYRLSQFHDSTPFYLFTNLTSLKHIEFVDLEPGALCDQSLTSILNAVGSQLESLVIHDGENLTDAFIHSITASCSSLTRLQLRGLTSITNDAVKDMFSLWSKRESESSISALSFERCVGLGDEAILAAIDYCQGSLVDLNLNSLKLLSGAVYAALAKLPNLTKLDLGFVGSVEPQHIYKFATTAVKLLFVYGNIRLTGMPLPNGITVVGTM